MYFMRIGVKMISNICMHAEKIYIEYLGATLLDLECVICRCRHVDEDKVDRKRCHSCEYAEISGEEGTWTAFWWSEFEGDRK